MKLQKYKTTKKRMIPYRRRTYDTIQVSLILNTEPLSRQTCVGFMADLF